MIRLSKFNNADFCRGASKAKEVCWWLVRCLFFMHSFPIPSQIKVFALKLFGAQIGKGVVIRSRVNITFPWKLEIGNDVWIGDDVYILSLEKVKIGSNVCVSQQAFLCTGSHDFKQETFDLTVKPITIEDGVWVCARVFIGPGVTVGSESVCFAGSIVTKNVPCKSRIK